jgi:nucleotide-binding universal stress UspA family protein
VQRRGADLVVMGTHGRRGLQRMVIGSVAERFVRYATCPVLLVRDAAHAEHRA